VSFNAVTGSGDVKERTRGPLRGVVRSTVMLGSAIARVPKGWRSGTVVRDTGRERENGDNTQESGIILVKNLGLVTTSLVSSCSFDIDL
jgi:hypothetical protein